MPSATIGAIAATTLRPGWDSYTMTLQPDLELRMQRAIRERRVARAQDDVFAKLTAEFLLQRLLHVDRCQDAETLCLQRLDGALDGLVVPQGKVSAYSITSLFHHESLMLRACQCFSVTVRGAEAAAR
jgi:hypothetical protein